MASSVQRGPENAIYLDRWCMEQRQSSGSKHYRSISGKIQGSWTVSYLQLPDELKFKKHLPYDKIVLPQSASKIFKIGEFKDKIKGTFKTSELTLKKAVEKYFSEQIKDQEGSIEIIYFNTGKHNTK